MMTKYQQLLHITGQIYGDFDAAEQARMIGDMVEHNRRLDKATTAQQKALKLMKALGLGRFSK